MRTMRQIALAVAWSVFAGAGVAEAVAASTYERILLPVYGPRVAGAYGSSWEVETWVHYSGPEPTEGVPRLAVCQITCPGPTWSFLPDEQPVRVETAYVGSSLLLYVDSTLADFFHVSSRVKELSRGVGLGTDIPVVRESQMGEAPLHLLNVPLNLASRATLRIYALPEVLDPEVEVSYFRMPDVPTEAPPVLRRTERVRLQRFEATEGYLIHPSSATLTGLEWLPELADDAATWVVITPLTPGLRIWGIVSVTDNASQQVTLITPN